MKKQQENKKISTRTLRKALWISGIIWLILFVLAIIAYNVYNPLSLLSISFLIFLAALGAFVFSFATVAVLVLLLKWEI